MLRKMNFEHEVRTPMDSNQNQRVLMAKSCSLLNWGFASNLVHSVDEGGKQVEY